jgi:hypothetical protein
VGAGDDVLVVVLSPEGTDVLVVVLSPEGTDVLVVVDSGGTLVLVVVGLIVVVVAPAGATPSTTGPTAGTSPHARWSATDTVTSVNGWPIAVAYRTLRRVSLMLFAVPSTMPSSFASG